MKFVKFLGKTYLVTGLGSTKCTAMSGEGRMLEVWNSGWMNVLRMEANTCPPYPNIGQTDGIKSIAKSVSFCWS